MRMSAVCERGLLRRMACAIALYVAALTLWLAIRPTRLDIVIVVESIAQGVALVWGLILCCLSRRWPVAGMSGVRPARRDLARAARWIPTFVGLGLLCDILSQGIQLYYQAIRHVALPAPSWADAAGLCAYPCYLLAMLLLPRRPLAHGSRTRVMLDVLITITVAAMCSWFYILGPTLLQNHATIPARIVASAYPLCDLMLIVSLVLLWAHSDDRILRPVLPVFTLALGGIVAADSVVDYRTLHGGTTFGAVADVGWTLGALLGGLGVCALRRYLALAIEDARMGHEPAYGDDVDADAAALPSVAPSIWRSMLPYAVLPVVGALGFHAWSSHAGDLLTGGIMLGSQLLIGLLIVRQVVSLRDTNRLYRELQVGEQRYRSLFTRHPDAVFSLGPEGTFRSVNAACHAISGYTVAELLDLPSFAPLVAPEHLDLAQHTFARTLAGEPGYTDIRLRRKDGVHIELSVTTVPIVVGGQVTGIFGIAKDTTAHRQAQAALQHQALHDALTGLPNRALLGDRLEQAIAAARRDGHSLALLLLDLDRFKEVNDTFGHHHGDQLLQQIAARLEAALRASDTVARLGGDEFAVLLPGADRAEALTVANQIAAALDAPCVVDGQRLQVGTSIGITLYPEHGLDYDTLLRQADVAMYLAKRGGTTCAVYAVEQDEHSPERLSLIADLRQAIEQRDLILHYQPKMDLHTGYVASVEALVRWPHPTRGPIAPAQFIPLAEHTGLIAPLTVQVLEMALGQYHEWQRRGLRLDVAVNLSMANLRDPQFVDSVLDMLDRYGVPPTALRLELTETTVMADTARSLEVLSRLAGHGVHISIDDFGTGYSSLAYLKRLPVDELKIDMSFVRHMAEDDTDAAIVTSTIELGHSLGLAVVAEGVEDRETQDRLVALGCDAAQGYGISRPLSSEQLESWLNQASRAA